MEQTEAIRLLLIEDNPGDARYIQELLRDSTELSDRVTGLGDGLGRSSTDREWGTPSLERDARLSDALERLDSERFDAVLLDLDLPDSTGLETLSTALEHTDTPVVVLTGLADHETGINALHRGASEYLVKDEINGDLLVRTVYHSIERREHEREQKLFETLVTESADLNAILSPDGTVQYVTPSVAHVLGYAPADLTDESVFALIHPDDREVATDALHTVVTNGSSSAVEFRVRNADGAWTVLEARSRNLLEDTLVNGIVVYARDITARRRRERKIERQRERLASLNHLSDVVHRITDAAIERSTREEIEYAVCEQLTASDSYLFAWIGEVDARTQTVIPRVEVNTGEYLEEVTVSVDSTDPRSEGPTGRAVRTRTVQVSNDTWEDPTYEPWSEQATKHGHRSSAAIPIVHAETLYGVLNVYAARPGAFEAEEQRVIGQLGEIVGHAIAAVDRKQALTGDEVVEIQLEIGRVFDASDGSLDEPVQIDRVVPVGDGEFLGYGVATREATKALQTSLRSLDGWDGLEFVGTEPASFRIRWSEPSVHSTIASYDGHVKSGVFENEEYLLTVHLTPGTDIRELLEALQRHHPAAKVMSKRQLRRTESPSRWHEHGVMEQLTDRQRLALEVAYFSGYFEWPRATEGKAVASSLDISPPTFSQHLRIAERKVFEALLETDSPAE
ncbi:bacterio-opsin activator domain-containing protein [Natrononativus amylolyticus]|uniref:bacterio-opsin activator domain-containing protein n=1 Tax=Natrononativus amylolyticus TaxID=2963434 RepID=UPI0020CC3A38|nr:bacterio-opsin activator domain-containing protein [Natrononativus amylolyticus]